MNESGPNSRSLHVVFEFSIIDSSLSFLFVYFVSLRYTFHHLSTYRGPYMHGILKSPLFPVTRGPTSSPEVQPLPLRHL